MAKPVIRTKVISEMCQLTTIAMTILNVSDLGKIFFGERVALRSPSHQDWNFDPLPYTQRNLFEILSNQIKNRLYLPFSELFGTKERPFASTSIGKWYTQSDFDLF